VLRTISEPGRNEGKENYKKLCNEKFHNFYAIANIVRMINQEGWAGQGM
jgi:hypothetical protein